MLVSRCWKSQEMLQQCQVMMVISRIWFLKDYAEETTGVYQSRNFIGYMFFLTCSEQHWMRCTC